MRKKRASRPDRPDVPQAVTEDARPAVIPAPAAVRRPWYCRDWVLVSAILVLGLILRVWYLAEAVHAPDFSAPQQDPAVMDYHARAIVTGDWSLPPGAETDPEIRTTPYFRPPGHAYFLAVVYFFTGGSYLAPRIVNTVTGLLSIVLLFLLGRSLFNRAVGLIAAFLAATYWGFIFWEGELNDPALFVFLGTFLMYVLLRWTARMGLGWAVLAGLICGGYALMRPNILLFGPFIAAWMLWIAWRRRRWRPLVASWCALALMTFLAIIPVTIRNYKSSGEFVPISTYFGENFLIGNGEDSDGVTPWTPYLQDLEGTGNWSVWVYINAVRGVGKELGIKNITHSAASSHFFHMALRFIREHKMRTLKLAFQKAILFWSPIEITCNKVVQYEKEFYGPLKYMPGFALITALLILGAAWLAWDLGPRSSTARSSPLFREVAPLIFLFVFVYYLSFLPFFVNGRARVPIIPFCLLLGSYGVYRAGEYAWARRYRPLATWLVVFAAIYGLASIQYVRFVPDRSRWHYQRADSYLRLGDVRKAIEEARPILDKPETASYMNMRLARAFAKEGYPDDALKHLMAAIANHPTDPGVLSGGAAELIKLGKIDEGLAHYQEALRLNPGDALSHNNLGLLLADQDKFGDALTHYQEAIRLDPQLSLARNNLGNLLARLGRYEDAIQCYEAAVQAYPRHEDYYYCLAVQLANAGRLDKAIEQYRAALDLVPDDARAHNNLGLLLAGRGQYDEALQHYQEALRVAPEFVLVYANWGNMLADQGKIDEGVAVYRKGLAIQPGDAGLHNGLGYLYDRKGAAEQAMKEYNEALRLKPAFPLAHNNLGNLLAGLGKLDDAIAHYNQALTIDPRDRYAHLNLGDTLMKQNRIDDAIVQYRAALDNAPNNPVVPNNLAIALVRKAQFDDAIRYDELALQLDPNYVNAHCNLGMVLAALGRHEPAVTHFKRALELEPNNMVAREGLDKTRAAARATGMDIK